MAMFYFPKEKILFQGDMFSPLDAGGGIPPVIEVHRELVKKVEKLGLEVETLIGVHSGAVAWKDFRAAVTNAASRPPLGPPVLTPNAGPTRVHGGASKERP